jgi:hypothetical protein
LYLSQGKAPESAATTKEPRRLLKKSASAGIPVTRSRHCGTLPLAVINKNNRTTQRTGRNRPFTFSTPDVAA